MRKTGRIVIDVFKKEEEQGISNKDGMDIALCRIDYKKSTLWYAGANNPVWIVRRGLQDKVTDENIISNEFSLIEVKADKQPIGFYPKMAPFTLHKISLQEGDAIYTFTDGYADQFGGPNGKKFKYKPLKELLLSLQDKTMLQQYSIILQTFNEWKEKFEQVDDICMIGVRMPNRE